jgi:hypothetical protein
MPALGGPVKAKVSGEIVEFNRLHLTVAIARPLPFDAIACTLFGRTQLRWECSLTPITAGTSGFTTVDARLNYEYYDVIPADRLQYIGGVDLVFDRFVPDPGYMYVIVWDRLSKDQSATLKCKVDGTYLGVMALYGPSAFYVTRDPLSGADNDYACTELKASVSPYYFSDQTARVVRLNVSDYTPYIHKPDVALWTEGRGILPFTKHKVAIAALDISALNLT